MTELTERLVLPDEKLKRREQRKIRAANAARNSGGTSGGSRLRVSGIPAMSAVTSSPSNVSV